MKEKLLTRKQIREGIIDILGEGLIEEINNIGSTSQFNILSGESKYIVLGTDLTDGFGVGVSINSFDSVCRDFAEIEYDDYLKIEQAIDFLTFNWSDNNYNPRKSFVKYMSSDFGEYFMF